MPGTCVNVSGHTEHITGPCRTLLRTSACRRTAAPRASGCARSCGRCPGRARPRRPRAGRRRASPPRSGLQARPGRTLMHPGRCSRRRCMYAVCFTPPRQDSTRSLRNLWSYQQVSLCTRCCHSRSRPLPDKSCRVCVTSPEQSRRACSRRSGRAVIREPAAAGAVRADARCAVASQPLEGSQPVRGPADLGRGRADGVTVSPHAAKLSPTPSARTAPASDRGAGASVRRCLMHGTSAQ
jgi:hypothetical protein